MGVHTLLQFFARFTDAEKAAIYAAARANDALFAGSCRRRSQDIGLDNPLVAVGLSQLVAAGLVAAPRVAEIVA